MRRVDWAFAACVLLAGCAGLDPVGNRPTVRAPFADPRLDVRAAAARLVPGRSTRVQVQAALGVGETLRLDSGWETWVYRSRDAQGDPVDGEELVLLFDPGGVLSKVRVLATRPSDARR